jgi:hypothetical protein
MGSQQPQEVSPSSSSPALQVTQPPKRPETQRIISGNNAEGHGIMVNGDIYEAVNKITYVTILLKRQLATGRSC